jgi:NitT/TauT family transport system ATP-binding protein
MITLNNITREFLSREGTRIKALDSVSFEAAPGSLTCIVGPTGSGKSTLLRIVAGLDQADGGTVLVDGKTPAARTGRTGYLTQRHTLFPWMRVSGNIGLPLEVRNVLEGERAARVAAICSQLGLAGSEDLYPYELSGGMQQRAALGRLLATDTARWLMDEPFTALDERTRHQIQQLLIDLASERSLTVLFVTHAIDEAVFLADRIVVLSAAPGRVVATIDVHLARPRHRLAPEYGACIEQVRTSIESVL